MSTNGEDVFCSGCGMFIRKGNEEKDVWCRDACRKAYERSLRPKAQRKYSPRNWTH